MEQKGRRQFVKFSFYRVDPAWRLLTPGERAEARREFHDRLEAAGDRMQLRTYSVAGTRGDADFLLWQAARRLEDIHGLAVDLLRTQLGAYLSMPYSYLAMTRRSVYMSPQEPERRTEVRPAGSRYLFVYPFVKTRDWYQLPLEERQRMMDEHIAVGRRYPSVKLNTTYSFGLDDQEFVVAFESDEPADFLDLVMELRETEGSRFTLRDTPIFTCIAMSPREMLETLAGPGDAARETVVVTAVGDAEWTPVARLEDLPEGCGKAVYCRGETVALFRSGRAVYALANACPHASGSLANGAVEGTVVTCPNHGSRFDLRDGRVLSGPASSPVRAFEVRIVDGEVLVGRAMAGERAGERPRG